MSKEQAVSTRIEIVSILSSRTREGLVELVVNDHKVQMDLPKAREVLAMLMAAIEAATSDQCVWAWLTTHAGLTPELAARALLDLREQRQGSRDVVIPS